MEEKKRISLILFLGIVFLTLLVMVVLIGYIVSPKNNNAIKRETRIGYYNESIPKNEGKNVSTGTETNSIDDTTTVYNYSMDDYYESAEYKEMIEKKINLRRELPQLAGTFHDILGLAKEWREVDRVTNFKDFEFDLDADGLVDKVTLRHIINEKESIYSSDRDYYVLEYDGKEIYSRWEGLGRVGIVDLDGSEPLLEVWVYDDGPSDDPVYHFYRIINGEIIKLGEFGIDRGFWADGKGKIVAGGRDCPQVSPCVYPYYYTIENNKFKEHKLDFSYKPDQKYEAFFVFKEGGGFFVEDYDDYKKIVSSEKYILTEVDEHPEILNEYNVEIIKPDQTFKILEFVDKESEYDVYDLKIKLDDGREGYLIHPYGRYELYD